MTKKKRLWRKITKNKGLLSIFLISLFWSGSLFLAPLSTPKDSVHGLDGYANRVDYNELWKDLPAFPRFIYTIGDAQCHQKSYRSFSLNGNQMPVDARSAAIYILLTAGLFTSMFASPSLNISESFITIFPRKVQRWVRKKNWEQMFLWLILIFLIAPTGVDGTFQLVTSYESSNLIRVITGSTAGWVIGFLMGIMIITVSELKGGENAV